MRTSAWTKPFGVLGAASTVAAALALAHVPAAGARTLPGVLCRAKNTPASGRPTPARRPKRCGLVSRRQPSKPAARLVKLRWTEWSARRAAGTGMAAGTTSRVEVTLRRPVRGCRGRVFSRAVLRARSGVTRFALPIRCAIGGGPQEWPGGGRPGGQQPGGGACVAADEAVVAGDSGPPSLSPALFDTTLTLDASLDGIDDDGTLPIDIGGVCGVPAGLEADAAKLAQLSGVAVLSPSTEIWTCLGSAEEAGSDDGGGCGGTPEKGGSLLQGDAATSAIDNADTAYIGVQLVPRAGWRQDEDGSPVPTFDAHWVKITD